jgi:hypothetical protein
VGCGFSARSLKYHPQEAYPQRKRKPENAASSKDFREPQFMKGGMQMSATMKGRVNFGIVCLALMIYVLCSPFLKVCYAEKSEMSVEPSKLLVFWTSGDREVFLKTVYILTYYSKERGWWNEIRLLIWGPSSKLLSEDKEIQQLVEKLKGVGVELIACKACSDMYGVSEKLQSLGINVYYVGSHLADMLKSGWVTLTF